jgi:hypothetical protein
VSAFPKECWRRKGGKWGSAPREPGRERETERHRESVCVRACMRYDAMREEAPREPAPATGEARGAGARLGGESTATHGSDYRLMRADAGWEKGGRLQEEGREDEPWHSRLAGHRTVEWRHTKRRGERGRNRLDNSMINVPLGEAKREFLYTGRITTTGRNELKRKDEGTNRYMLPATGRAASEQ